MRTFLKIFVAVAVVTSLNSCFESGDTKDPKEDPKEQPVDTSAKEVDTLSKVEEPIRDTGIVIKEEVKETGKN